MDALPFAFIFSPDAMKRTLGGALYLCLELENTT